MIHVDEDFSELILLFSSTFLQEIVCFVVFWLRGRASGLVVEDAMIRTDIVFWCTFIPPFAFTCHVDD